MLASRQHLRWLD